MTKKGEQHIIVEKQFVYKYPWSPWKRTINSKDLKLIKAAIVAEYDRWSEEYIKKIGVVGPDEHPRASKSEIHRNGREVWTGVKVRWIMDRRRHKWEQFWARLYWRNALMILTGALKKEKKK